MRSQSSLPGGLYPDKSKVAVRIIIIVMLLMAVVLIGALAYFWQQERATARELRDKLSQLGVTNTEPNSKKPDPTPAKLCQNTTVRYTATIGKFSVTLPDSQYVIINNQESKGEGGPASIISLGKCQDAANNVVSNLIDDQVTLTATPTSNWTGTTFDQWVTGRLEDAGTSPPQELERVVIDGVSARDFRVQGLLENRVTFFEKNGIWYELEARNTSSDTTPGMQARNALIQGLTFTE